MVIGGNKNMACKAKNHNKKLLFHHSVRSSEERTIENLTDTRNDIQNAGEQN